MSDYTIRPCVHCGKLLCFCQTATRATPLPGILSDLHVIKERAERVRGRAIHKDLEGGTARQLAMDVLALIEALEEAYP